MVLCRFPVPISRTGQDYGEERLQALIEGFDAKLYVVVFTMRGDVLWVISFRRARERERGNYV